MIDLTNKQSIIPEMATFDLEEISSEEHDLIECGSVFRWSIGYEILPGGTKQRVSRIVFRRLPAWRKPDLDKAEKIADEIYQNLTND